MELKWAKNPEHWPNVEEASNISQGSAATRRDEILTVTLLQIHCRRKKFESRSASNEQKTSILAPSIRQPTNILV